MVILEYLGSQMTHVLLEKKGPCFWRGFRFWPPFYQRDSPPGSSRLEIPRVFPTKILLRLEPPDDVIAGIRAHNLSLEVGKTENMPSFPEEGEMVGGLKQPWGNSQFWKSTFFIGILAIGGGNSKILFMFIPKFGAMIPFDEHIFQIGRN